MSHYGHKMNTIIGPMENIKITTPTDFFIFRAMVEVHENQQILDYKDEEKNDIFFIFISFCYPN